MTSPRVMIQIPALVAGFLGFILLFVALATPAWQVVYARELRQWVQSGLWMSCQTRPSGMYTCTYTFSQADFDFFTSAEVVNIRTPAFYPWQRTLLHVLLVGQVIALFAFIFFCISNAEAFQKMAAVGYSILMGVTTFIGFGCMLAFAAYSNMVEYRFYHVSVSGIYEKHHGYSYYVAIVGCVFYLISLGLSIAYTIKLLQKDGYNSSLRQETINAYRPPLDDWRSSQFSSPYMSEDQFAMRALPEVPRNKIGALPMLEHFTLAKCQLAGAVFAAVACFFLFIATITPAWQVAEDKDVQRYVQSGLWLYCPGATQCWYIFSDNLINYYEKVDVCRFLLIGDCRKKLLRTPYFFGWHYAVLVLNLITLALLSGSVVTAAIAYWKPQKRKITTVVFDCLIFMATLILTISLLVFMANAEMLESKYLIGVKNTFEKEYGYSFYLACIALFISVFAMLAAALMTTFTFFHLLPVNEEELKEGRMSRMASVPGGYRTSQYYQEQPKLLQQQQQRDSVSQYLADGTSTVGFHTPMRSSTPMSQLPQLNVTHGEYIAAARSPTGQFVPTTRHFYSY